MYKSFKFRLYPDKIQLELINKSFGGSRFIYNHYLANIKNNGYKDAYYITIETYSENDIYNKYTLIVSVNLKDNTYEIEKYIAGNSFYEAIESMKTAKEILISNGARCK